MIAYLDSSVLLRVLLAEPGRLPEYDQLERAISSELLKVECLRTIDRLRIALGLRDEEVARRNAVVRSAVSHVDLVRVSRQVLDRAGLPFASTLGTLDAIHLSSAMLWRERKGDLPYLLTHDPQLGSAARLVGFDVLGC